MSPLSGPKTYKINSRIIAQAASGTADASIGEAEAAGTVTAVTFTPDANITGATATKRTITLENRGQDGSGTTVVATLDLVTGVNPVKHDEYAFTLSGTAANLNVAAGDVLVVKEAVTSTGTANPGGRIEVTISRGEVGA